MPFQSKAQARFMFAEHPAIAKEFASKTPSIKALPDHVKKDVREKALTNEFHKQLTDSDHDKK